MKEWAFRPVWKVALVYLIFMMLYVVFRFFPVFPLSIIAAVNESNFQHYKATFFSFLIAGGVEYLRYYKVAKPFGAFWSPRLLAASLSPWLVFLFWYIAPAVLGGPFPQIWQEIVYANVITLITFSAVVVLERSFFEIPLSKSLTGLIAGLFVISIFLYMTFTFSHLPWADVFIEPEW
jgi:hypothetical protein